MRYYYRVPTLAIFLAVLWMSTWTVRSKPINYRVVSGEYVPEHVLNEFETKFGIDSDKLELERSETGGFVRICASKERKNCVEF